MVTKGIKVIAKNKRASYDYFLTEKFQAGLVLQGTEVKSLRDGKVTIAESHIDVDKNGEIWIHNMTIAHYMFGNINNHEETRKRKLLLTAKEIKRISHERKAQRLTIVPTIIYFKGQYVKLEIALAKGKKNYDKRQEEAKKDANMKIKRQLLDH